MPQLNYQDQTALPAFEGGLYDSGPSDKVSRSPGGNVAQVSTILFTTTITAVAQVSTLTVDTAAAGDAYTLQIGEFTFTGTSAGTDTSVQATAIRAQLAADNDFGDLYTVSGAGDDIIVTADRPGVGFSVTETVEATSAWSWVADTVANVIGTHVHLNVGGFEFRFAATSTTEADEIDDLQTALEADLNISALVDYAQPTTTTLTLTAKTAGTPFSITMENENDVGISGSGDITLTAATVANVTGDPVPFGRALARGASDNVIALPSATSFVFEGVSIARAKGRPKDNTTSPPTTGDAVYKGDEAVNVLRKGRIWVRPEQAVTPASDIYIRFAQGVSAAHTVGRFRTDADTANADQLSDARWISSADADALAVLEINLP